MPLYNFKCSSCDHEFEELVSNSDTTDLKCPKCASSSIEKKVTTGTVQSNSKPAAQSPFSSSFFTRGG